MRRLPLPTFDERAVYDACVSGVPVASAADFAGVADQMMILAEQYRTQAAAHTLHVMPACNRGQPDQLIVDPLTKADLKRLYERGMLASANGRTYYDQILASAPLWKCPYCRFGHAETLDHFLAKSLYPSFAVLPGNLVPSCMRCNKGKGDGLVTPENEMSHPYFESAEVEQEQWLVANVLESSPVSTKYSIMTPAHWSAALSRRVRNYFKEFDLASRYAVEAASELVAVACDVQMLKSPDDRRAHLQRMAIRERGIAVNGWKAALYTALSESDWYIETGYA